MKAQENIKELKAANGDLVKRQGDLESAGQQLGNKDAEIERLKPPKPQNPRVSSLCR